MATNTANATRDLTAEIAFLTRALKAATLRRQGPISATVDRMQRPDRAIRNAVASSCPPSVSRVAWVPLDQRDADDARLHIARWA